MITRAGYVSTPEAVGLIKGVVQAAFPNAQRVRKGAWATPLSAEITAMVTVDHWKGGAFSVGYGICCAWVPYSHRSGVTIEWPTTTRECVKHLWVDHFTVDTPTPPRISQLDGLRTLHRQARRAVRQTRRSARTWWAGVSTTEGVLAEAQRQAAHRHDLHSPRAGLVAAFTLARLGDMPAARKAFSPLETSMTENRAGASGLLAGLLEVTPQRFRAEPR